MSAEKFRKVDTTSVVGFRQKRRKAVAIISFDKMTVFSRRFLFNPTNPRDLHESKWVYSQMIMDEMTHLHHSFIVRCWRDAKGLLRGWVVDALTQCSYPFATRDEMTARIESLTRELQKDKNPEADDETDEALSLHLYAQQKETRL